MASAAAAGNGVEAASEALSAEDAGGGSSKAAEAGDEGASSFLVGVSVFDPLLLELAAAALLFLFLSLPSDAGANFFKRPDDSLRTTSSLGVPAPLERPLAREVDVEAGMVSSESRDGRQFSKVDAVGMCCHFPFRLCIPPVGRPMGSKEKRRAGLDLTSARWQCPIIWLVIKLRRGCVDVGWD